MAAIKNFGDLESWKKARELAGHIYRLTRKESFSHDFGLRRQIQRAAGSIMHNIAEGFDCGSDPEFVRFLKMARRSTSEVQSELYLALDCGYVTSEELKQTYGLALEVKKLINGLMTYLRKNQQTRRLATRKLAD